MTTHRIRLPAPWQVREASDRLQKRWHIQRKFNKPTGIASDTQLAIEVAMPFGGPLVQLNCRLNSHLLAASPEALPTSGELDVVRYSLPLDKLADVNLLELELEFAQPQELVWPQVCLALTPGGRRSS